MPDRNKIFNRWFWSWLGISALLVIFIMFVPMNWKKSLSATIMSLFMVMPVRDWLYRLLVWAIDYVSSNYTDFKDRIHPHATYNRIITPTTREENIGFYRILKFAIIVITLILGILWQIFSETSFYVVYSWLHTIEFLVTGRIGWVRLLIYILITLAYWRFVFWAILQVLNATMYDDENNFSFDKAWWRILLMVTVFYAKILITSMLLLFTSSMVWASIKFWTVVVGFPILVMIIYETVSHRFNTDSD